VIWTGRHLSHGRVRYGQQDKRGRARKVWRGIKLRQPGWGEHSRSLAFEAQLRREGLRVYLILNAYSESLEFQLPLAGEGAGSWRRWIDTALQPSECCGMCL
jgi:isoamylase